MYKIDKCYMLIKNYRNLIKKNELRKKALQIINSGLEAVKTEKIINEKVSLRRDILIIRDCKNKVRKINLRKYKKIVLIGFGKASSLMGKEIEKILGQRVSEGVVISTRKLVFRNKKIRMIKGTHPMPSLKNIKAAKRIVGLLKKLDKDDLVICLVSGGGSALLCYPKVSLVEYLKTVNKAFKSGIDIKRLNKIRTRLSNIKGGKLAKLTKASIVSLIFSDVVGDDLSVIASGPTVCKGLKNVRNILLLNNDVALDGMKKKASSLGLNPLVNSNKVTGESRLIGRKLVNVYKNKVNESTKNCLLFAGETTVTVKVDGKGGRNQELCLGAIEDISKLSNCCLVSIGSDGIDGNSDAAGAIIDNRTFSRSKRLNLDYKKYLKDNDSHHFFKKTGDLVYTGLTGSNVADIGVILRLK